MKTVRVRIAVAVNADGKAVACGYEADRCVEPDPERLMNDWGMLESYDVDEKLAFAWIEADVPLPEPVSAPVVEGRVEP